MAQALTVLVNELQSELRLGMLGDFEPFFELVGSMAEGTRIGLANELDLVLKFKAFMGQAPFKVDKEDPFSLKKAVANSSLLESFFEGRYFLYHKFMHFVSDAVENALENIFVKNTSLPSLKRVTPNKEWREGKTPCRGKCKKELEQRNFVQCEECIVTVSTTKSGVALQFLYDWGHNGKAVYCSIDLIPIFPIEAIPTMELTRAIVGKMLSEDAPPGWLQFMFKYPKDYKIIQHLAKSGTGQVISVGLKTMTFLEGRNYHIKPSQEFTETKFTSERMKVIYSYIKFLKKSHNVDISSYWVKKELLKPEYQSILDSCIKGINLIFRPSNADDSDNTNFQIDRDDVALLNILSQPEFKVKFGDKIDFEESNRLRFIQSKREWVAKALKIQDS